MAGAVQTGDDAGVEQHVRCDAPQRDTHAPPSLAGQTLAVPMHLGRTGVETAGRQHPRQIATPDRGGPHRVCRAQDAARAA